MKTVYFDNNATTQVAPEVTEAMLPFFRELWGNPSSMHSFGGRVASYVEEGRAQVAELLGASPDEIIFTSCGTESDNAALFSAIQTQPSKRHIVISCVEHPAVLQSAAYWERQGYRVTRLGVDAKGRIVSIDVPEAAGKKYKVFGIYPGMKKSTALKKLKDSGHNLGLDMPTMTYFANKKDQNRLGWITCTSTGKVLTIHYYLSQY